MAKVRRHQHRSRRYGKDRGKGFSTLTMLAQVAEKIRETFGTRGGPVRRLTAEEYWAEKIAEACQR
jgi:hypothetical protein